MIIILTLLMSLIMFFFSFFIKRKATIFSQAFGKNITDRELKQCFSMLGNCYLILAILGLGLSFLNTKLVTLLFITIILIVSAIFSLKISKLVQ